MAGIGLTESQLRAVQDTWAIVEENLRDHGVAVFVRVFRTYPDVKQMFRRIKNVPDEDLEKAAGVRAHATGFMKEVSGMIENLENTEDLLVMIESNAHRHHRRKATVQHYEAVLGMFTTYLKETLGDKFTEDAAEGWQCVTKAITTNIAKEYEVIEAEQE